MKEETEDPPKSEKDDETVDSLCPYHSAPNLPSFSVHWVRIPQHPSSSPRVVGRRSGLTSCRPGSVCTDGVRPGPPQDLNLHRTSIHTGFYWGLDLDCSRKRSGLGNCLTGQDASPDSYLRTKLTTDPHLLLPQLFHLYRPLRFRHRPPHALPSQSRYVCEGSPKDPIQPVRHLI